MTETLQLKHCPKCGSPIPAGAPEGLCPKCVLIAAATSGEAEGAATDTGEIPSLERVAVAFPQLEIIELIGRGGMGFVFKARQPHLDRFVALKLLPDKLARDPRFAERFNREGRVLARLNHPNIVSVYDFGQTEHFYYLLMEYVDGVNLRQAMQAGRFSPGEALAIVPKICEALQYAHGQGILHRDIKPANILLDSRGHVKIADFGIAKLVGDEKPDVTLTATGASLGTPHYMAPEQLEKPSEVDHRADIYSLGVVFYEMLTGELPIGRFAAPSSKTPVGANVDEVVFRTLEKDRERRYQSAGEMKTQVEHLTEPGAGGLRSVPPIISEVAVPKWSQKAIWAGGLTGISILPIWLMLALVVSMRGGIGAAELLILVGFMGLPGLAGVILGWMGLSDIRAHQGRLRGLPLAVFGAVTWPSVLLLILTLVVPMLITFNRPGSTRISIIGGLLFTLVPAGTITFVVWAIYAAARWGGNRVGTQRHGALKWIFLGLMMAGLGITLLGNNSRRIAESQLLEVETEPALYHTPVTPEVAPKIQFTVTMVELRHEPDGSRWLEMNYNQQIRGDCEPVFRYDTSVPGFTAATKKIASLSDAKADFEPVRQQKILWKLPDALTEEEARSLYQMVAKERVGKSFVVEEGEEYPLFKVLVPQGGSLVTSVSVARKSSLQ